MSESSSPPETPPAGSSLETPRPAPETTLCSKCGLPIAPDAKVYFSHRGVTHLECAIFDVAASPVLPEIPPTPDTDDGVTAIEVSFAIPVHISNGERDIIAGVIEKIARANCPAGHVHWLSDMGSKPQLSQADARFLGKPVDPNAPERGEPTFDNSILHFGTYCREK